MESKRQIKFSRQLQKDLSGVFQKDTRHFFGNSMATITRISISPDLRFAKIYLSIFPVFMAGGVFENLEKIKSEIRNKLGRKISSRVRGIPELVFFHDDTEEKASHMDQLINKLDIPPAEESEEE